MSVDRRRALPSVDAVVRAAGEVDAATRPRLVAAAREAIEAARASGDAPDAGALALAARSRLAERDRPTLRRVINATGVVLHTNLGRAPLSRAALDAIATVAAAATVEYDLATGKRGERHGHAARLLADVTGAEDGVVANNGAAAVLLALAALAARRDVIVSRGELIEIGGSFRIPDVLARSGARLVEVGTTNRTYLRDYAAAVTERTGAILRVHTSNFRVVGFTARPDAAALASLARERGIALVHDLGSGTLLDTARYGLGREETVQEAVSAGADVVTFSGDKLLGGPQAGLAVGRAETIAKLRSHPLMRAVRPDKLTIAALVATLAAYRDGTAERDLPVWRLIAADPASLERRARVLAERVGGEAVATRSTVGGGSLPEETQPSWAVALAGRPQELAARLRRADPPVIGRVVDERFALDVRSVLPEDDGALGEAVAAALTDREA
ncbi:MAG TPA: L-seryl-tRNA(Sec) selenium transferase [Candidatus Limnocylindria bacterium]|nr:L-seryl-tRNA(Sec) selenium transferase [Candidatus Limnocylindria bacterium]